MDEAKTILKTHCLSKMLAWYYEFIITWHVLLFQDRGVKIPHIVTNEISKFIPRHDVSLPFLFLSVYLWGWVSSCASLLQENPVVCMIQNVPTEWSFSSFPAIKVDKCMYLCCTWTDRDTHRDWLADFYCWGHKNTISIMFWKRSTIIRNTLLACFTCNSWTFVIILCNTQNWHDDRHNLTVQLS